MEVKTKARVDLECLKELIDACLSTVGKVKFQFETVGKDKVRVVVEGEFTVDKVTADVLPCLGEFFDAGFGDVVSFVGEALLDWVEWKELMRFLGA